MRRMLPVSVLSLSVLVALSATGCAQVSDALSGPAPTPVKVKVSGGDRLSLKQARASVLTERDLPARWTAVKASPDRSDAEAKPEVGRTACERAFLKVSADQSAAPTAEAKGEFRSGTGLFTIALRTEVSSFTRGNQAADVRRVEKVLQKCPNITMKDGGQTMKVTVSPLTFPTLGEETLATRMTVRSRGQKVTLDLVAVGIGHNVVTFWAAGLKPLATPALEQIARAGVARMAATSEPS
jgi:hypothetical protein